VVIPYPRFGTSYRSHLLTLEDGTDMLSLNVGRFWTREDGAGRLYRNVGRFWTLEDGAGRLFRIAGGLDA
jgi:hypothetical protein